MTADHLVVLGYMPVVVFDGDPGVKALARLYTHESQGPLRGGGGRPGTGSLCAFGVATPR